MYKVALPRLMRNLRDHGVLVTIYKLYYLAYGLIFDFWHGTDTTSTTTIDQHGYSKGSGTGNFPCHPRLLRRFLALCELKQGDVVLDIGCGKGRAVIVSALQYPQCKVLGVDIVPENIQTADRNSRKIGLKNVDFQISDARYGVPSGAKLWMVFNPFDKEFVKTLIQDAENRPGYVLLINLDLGKIDQYERVSMYYHPIYPNFNFHLYKRV